MPTALIADDEPLMRVALQELLTELWPEAQLLAEAEDGPQALRLIQELRPDVAFLDIRMPGLTGLEVARAASGLARVVFVTAYDNHAVQAFEANAVDYVLKPVERVRLAQVVTKLRQSLAASPVTELQRLKVLLDQLQVAAPTPHEAKPDNPHRGGIEWLQVDVGRQIRLTRLEDVMCFKSDHRYTLVVTPEWEGLVRLSLKTIMESAPLDLFVQTHRAALVNRRFIKAIREVDDTMEVILTNDDKVTVSQSNHGLFKAM